MSAEVFIGQRPISYFEEEQLPLSLSYQLKDFNFFDKSSGSFSNSFRLPATTFNDVSFGGYRFPNKLNAYLSFLAQQDASVYQGGHRIFKGKVKGEGAGSDYYKMKFIGSNLEWASDMEDRLLNSLSHPVKTYGTLTAEASWANTYTDRWTAPLVNYGMFENYTDPLPSTPFNMDGKDFRYWHFIRPIVEEMFQLAGYTLQSTFFTSSMFSKLICYFNDNDIYHDDLFPLSSTIDMGADLISNDRTCLEFLKGVTHMFNIMYHTDVNTKTVYAEPFPSFFNTDPNTIVNWDHLKDDSKDAVIKQFSNLKSSLLLKYPGEDELVNQQLEKWKLTESNNLTNVDTSIVMGGSYNMGNVFDVGVSESANPFFDSCLSGFTSIADLKYIPTCFIWDSFIEASGERPEKSGDTSPRVLYYAGLTDITKFGIYTPFFTQWKYNATLRSLFPYAYTCDFCDLDSLDVNINYNDEQTLGLGIATGVPIETRSGLLNTNYLEMMTTMRKGQEFQPFMNLNSYNVKNHDFRKYYTVENQQHILLEISKYNPFKTVSTHCRMLKRHYLDDSDAGRVKNGNTTWMGTEETFLRS